MKALEPSSWAALGGAETFESHCCEGVDYADHQGHFWPNNGQANTLLFGKGDQCSNIIYSDIDILQPRFSGGACVARGNENTLCKGGLGRFPAEGVLASATADDQYVHMGFCLLT